MNTPSKEDRQQALTLEILNEISDRSDVTQRHLAEHLGVALGLANSYLKRCVRKGFVKIQQAPANRYLYYITPQGFAEKSRLTAQYLGYSFDFYRHASAAMLQVANNCKTEGVNRVVFGGVSELAEIASIRFQDSGLELIGTYDPSSMLEKFVDRPVWRELDKVPPFDAAVFTALVPASRLYRQLVEVCGAENVHVLDTMRALTLSASDIS